MTVIDPRPLKVRRIIVVTTDLMDRSTHCCSILVVILLAFVSLPSFAGFSPNANGTVFAVTQQMDGKVLIGGIFTSVNGTARNGIALLNADGSLDTRFNLDMGVGHNVGVFNRIKAVTQQADGKVLVGGFFNSVNATERNNIARLNTDGTLDIGFDSSAGANGSVDAITQQADGKVLIGGNFTRVNGIARNYVARLNADGSLDTGFDTGTGADAGVVAVTQQADGKVLISGFFTSVNGTIRSGIARLNADGSLDIDFDPNIGYETLGVNNGVKAVIQQADGKVLIGGFFTSVNGIARNRIARLNADGSLDTDFDPSTGANNTVKAVTQQADGKVLIVGDFTNVNGISRSGSARLNVDGSLNSSFNPDTLMNIVVETVALQADGKMLIGGSFFFSANGTTRGSIARLNANGSLDLTAVGEDSICIPIIISGGDVSVVCI